VLALSIWSALVISRGNMFQYRSSAFGPSVAAIQKHLGAVEKELEKIGRIAGDRTSAAAATASDQLGDAISTILNEMVERFRRGRQAAGDQAGRLSNQALNLGAKYGSDALQRAASEVEERPLVTVAIALGIGILIGAAVLTSTGSSRCRR
jgi:ElaB/YqjD/DUF883 family membrane-anchored ribosome-binding protein